MVDGESLRQRWPVLAAGCGTNFVVDSCARDAAVPLSLYDQGRAVSGKYHGMGVGIKLTAPRAVARPNQAVPAGTKLLSFVVVARLSNAPDPLAALDDVVKECRQRGVGGERGYGVLLGGRCCCTTRRAPSATRRRGTRSASHRANPRPDGAARGSAEEALATRAHVGVTRAHVLDSHAEYNGGPGVGVSGDTWLFLPGFFCALRAALHLSFYKNKAC